MSTHYGLCAYTDMEVKPHRSLCCGWGQCEAITKYWVTERCHGVFLKNEPISVERNIVWFSKCDHHLSTHAFALFMYAYVLFMFTAHHDAIVQTASISLWRGAGTPRLAVPHEPVILGLEQSSPVASAGPCTEIHRTKTKKKISLIKSQKLHSGASLGFWICLSLLFWVFVWIIHVGVLIPKTQFLPLLRNCYLWKCILRRSHSSNSVSPEGNLLMFVTPDDKWQRGSYIWTNI